MHYFPNLISDQWQSHIYQEDETKNQQGKSLNLTYVGFKSFSLFKISKISSNEERKILQRL